VEEHAHQEPDYAVGSSREALVADVPELSRYELRLAGRLIGVAAYRRRDDRLVFTHTEVADAFEGRGFGTQLVLEALDDVRRQDATVVPLCPFVAHQIDAHPEYRDLLAPDHHDG
jgi:predicted GNAT family acetyltransferase